MKEIKMTYSTLLYITLLVIFYGCSDSNDIETVVTENASKSLFLKIDNYSNKTYTESAPTAEEKTVLFNSGGLLLVNKESGVIYKLYKLSTEKSDYNNGGFNVNLEDIQEGIIFDDILGQVNAVCVIGNTSLTMFDQGKVSLPTIQNYPLMIYSQYIEQNLNLYGQEDIVLRDNKGYTCVVNCNPTVARFELPKLTAEGSITSFEIEGIFMDNFYMESNIKGDKVINLRENGNSPLDFSKATSQYPIELNKVIYNYYEDKLASIDKSVFPINSKVWGYYLFATPDEKTPVPRIVIRLTNIKTNNGMTFSQPQFITINGFRENGEKLTSISPGKVYKVNEIFFNEYNLSPTPNTETIEAGVTVVLADWETVGVNVEL